MGFKYSSLAAYLLILLLGSWITFRLMQKNHVPQEFSSTSYRNAGYGFGFEYGNEFRLLEGAELIQSQSYIPPCEPDSIACLYYPKEAFGNTNFGGAGFGIRVIPDVDTCPTPRDQGAGIETGSEQINGVDFQVVVTGGAAMHKQNKDAIYRVVREGTCYEVLVRLNTSVFEVYEPGTIERFTPQMETKVRVALGEVLQSLRFIAD
jgi:hypothetical protein